MDRPKSSEADMARQLVLEHGPKVARQKAVGEKMKAKRARSRNDFQYWSAVVFEIQSASTTEGTLPARSKVEFG